MSPSPRTPSLRIVMMPADTNPQGTVFGGVILSHVDVAGVLEARRHGLHRYVTVALDKVHFKQPVFVGDVVTLLTSTLAVGHTSVTVKVDVWSERYDGRSCVDVTNAIVTYVAVDARNRPIPVRSDHTLPWAPAE